MFEAMKIIRIKRNVEIVQINKQDKPGNHYLCFQLWGADPTYVIGLKENIRLAKIYYPNHKILVYTCDNITYDLPDCDTINEQDNGWYNYFWRLHAFDDRKFDTISFRDADSRPSTKEAQTEQEWRNSDKLAYIMHDHKQHSSMIMAGMWGIRGDVIKDMRKMINEWIQDKRLEYGSDQLFLHQIIFPLIKMSIIRYGTRTKYPTQTMENCEFIGQKIIVQQNDDSGSPR